MVYTPNVVKFTFLVLLPIPSFNAQLNAVVFLSIKSYADNFLNAIDSMIFLFLLGIFSCQILSVTPPLLAATCLANAAGTLSYAPDAVLAAVSAAVPAP